MHLYNPNNSNNNVSEEASKPFTLNPNTPTNIPQPSPFPINFRGRLNSFNSSFVSPMRLIQSPMMTDMQNLFDLQLRPNERQKLEKFRLNNEEEYQDHNQDANIDQRQKQSDSEDQSLLNEIDISFRNLIQTIVVNLGINDIQIQKKRKELADNLEQPLLLNIYDSLIKKFKKLRKTKEEMTKYCMRKIRKEAAILGLKDNGDCLNYYFNKFEHDKNFSIPFKKNSIDKTMNSNFLAKIFSCPLFVKDYQEYLKIFKYHAQRDNDKKINALSKLIEKSVQTKNLKKLQNFKRLPWTEVIVNKTIDLAKSFLDYAKQSKEEIKIECNIREDLIKQQKQYNPQLKKKSIILLTPPMRPLSSPLLEQKLEDLKY